SLAVKFFVSVLVPLALVLLMDGKERWYRAFLAVLILAGAFSLFSLFNYNPWDLQELLRVHKSLYANENTSRLEGFLGYFRSFVSSLGLMTSVFVVIGVGVALVQHGRNLWERARKNTFHQGILGIMSHPNTVVASLFVAQFWIITGVGPQGIGHPVVRHSLPFIPLLCFAASVGFLAVLSQMGRSRVAIIGTILLVFGYQVYNAVGTEQIFRHDIRIEASQWIEKNVSREETVTAFMPYSKVGRNVAYNQNSERLGDYIVTCDLEYKRYFRYDDANRTPAAHGGRKRFELFRELFAGRLNYEIVKEFHEQQYTLEHHLIEKEILGGLDTFTPRRYVIFKRIRGSG
ncbi:MAG: hypothetical protein MN733_39475, partial [Nitrososphaera sp.]|nr:hypothetical protein [Nitrososphaera sp.]